MCPEYTNGTILVGGTHPMFAMQDGLPNDYRTPVSIGCPEKVAKVLNFGTKTGLDA